MTTDTEVRSKTLAELVLERVERKRAEDDAVEARKVVDALIAAKLPRPADKATASEKLKDISLKVSVSYGENVKVDAELLRADIDSLPPAICAAFRWKPEVDTKAWDALTTEQKLVAAKYVTRTPATPGVKLEVI